MANVDGAHWRRAEADVMTDLQDEREATISEITLSGDGLLGYPASLVQTPEKRLMLAVLEDAAATVSRCAGRQTSPDQRAVEEVERWYSSEDGHWPFSFINVCDALGLDPSCLRRGFLRLRRSAASGHATRTLPRRTRERAGTRTHVVVRTRERRSPASAAVA